MNFNCPKCGSGPCHHNSPARTRWVCGTYRYEDVPCNDPQIRGKVYMSQRCTQLQLIAAQAIVGRLRTAELSQCGWEDSEDIVLLNGKPVGGTITKHSREFNRWWPSVKDELLGIAAEAAREATP